MEILHIGNPGVEERIINHFIQLSKDERRSRFYSIRNDDQLREWVNGLKEDERYSHHFIVELINDLLVGVLHCSINKGLNQAEIGVSVLGDYQGQKISSRMFKLVKAFLVLNKVRRMYIYFEHENYPCKAMLKSAGFTFNLQQGYAEYKFGDIND